MVTPFAVTEHAGGTGVSRLAITGEIDHDTGEGLAGLIANAARRDGVTEVVVDLRRVTFLAAAGVRALLHGCAAAHAAGCAFRVIDAHGIVHRVLAICGVLELLAVTTPSGAPSWGTFRP